MSQYDTIFDLPFPFSDSCSVVFIGMQSGKIIFQGYLFMMWWWQNHTLFHQEYIS